MSVAFRIYANIGEQDDIRFTPDALNGMIGRPCPFMIAATPTRVETVVRSVAVAEDGLSAVVTVDTFEVTL